MEITIAYILVYIVEALILFLYCSRLFLPKRDKTVFLITYCLGYSSLFIISNFNIFWLNTLAFCLMNAFLIFFLYEASPSQSFFHALIITVCMGMSELVIMSAISHFSYNFYQSVSFFQRVCILSVTSKILYFVMMYHFSNFWMRKKSNYHALNYESIIMTLIPLFSFWIMITLAFICSTTALSVSIDRMISVSSFLLLLVNLLIWDIYQIMQHRNTEYTQMQLQLQKEYDQKQYHETILKQDEEQRILIHDMKQHLQSLAALNQKKEHEKIDSYLSQLITSSSLQSPMRVCDHELMNQIIYRYQRMCQEKQISLRTDIRKNCLHFLTDSELTSLFCNLLDNAVTAADYSADTYIHLSIRRHEESQSCVIAMVNSCRNNPFPSNGRKLYTTKKSKKYHGFGLKSIQKIVDSHNGSMEMYYDDDMQEFHTILMLK